jgi:hypothetical protein
MSPESHVATRSLVPAPFTGRPSSFAEMEKLAQWFADSQSVPPAYRGKPADCFVAIQMGLEVGLAPMQAIQNIATINGRPAIYGDAMLGLCWQSPLCEDISERMEGTGDDRVAICIAKRRGASIPVERRFSVADAKRAKLWQEKATVTKTSRDGGTYEADSGVWFAYPERMLQMRARGFALRDAFPDVLRGLLPFEEATDTPPADRFGGTTIDGSATVVQPEPAPVKPTPAPADPTPAPAEPVATPPQETATPPADAGSTGNGSKWKVGLETALAATKTEGDLDKWISAERFVAWRVKASMVQELEIAKLIADRRAVLAAAAQVAPATTGTPPLDDPPPS